MPSKHTPSGGWRTLQSTSWLWIFRLLAVVALLASVYSWHERTGTGWMLGSLCVGLFSWQLSKHAIPNLALPSGGPRDAPRILILRLFSQDYVYVDHHTELEKIIVDTLGRHGECEMVGKPGRPLPAVRARLYYFSDLVWQDEVPKLARRARAIVVVLAELADASRAGEAASKHADVPGAGLWWELQMLEHEELLHKTIFVIPPTNSLRTRRRPTTLYGAEITPSEQEIVVIFNPNGPKATTHDQPIWNEPTGTSIRSYREALSWAYATILHRLEVAEDEGVTK